MARVTGIDNSWTLADLRSISGMYRDATRLWIHVPDYLSPGFARWARESEFRALDGRSRVTVNILNQNIRLCPDPSVIQDLLELGFDVTVTTAHQAYTTPEERARLGAPLHHFSVWIARDQYAFAQHVRKRNHLHCSPDDSELNHMFTSRLAVTCPEVSTSVVQDMAYEDYLRVALTSKWSVAFGEGLDGYFAETAFAGGLPFAVYNEEFFTPEFRRLPNVFESPSELIEGAPSLISETSIDEDLRVHLSDQTSQVLEQFYESGSHIRRVTRYFLDDFDHP